MSESDTYTILVLDAAQRSALAVTRSLGKRKDIQLLTADEFPAALAGQSKYSQQYFQCPSSTDSPISFVSWLAEFVEAHGVDLLMPVTEVTSQLILMHIDRFNGCKVPFADLQRVNQLSNKWQLIELAKNLGVPTPESRLCHNAESLWQQEPQEYPVVIKPVVSRIWEQDHWVHSNVHIARDRDALVRLLEQHSYLSEHPTILQEYIPGTGAGVFSLYNNGEPVTYFTHTRLREKPPSGGVSVLSASAELDQAMTGYAESLLKGVNWHGVAMVEFRVSPKGNPYLMEVNTRFWGSLQLAIDSGVDFPALLFQVAMGLPTHSIEHYRIGQKLRWLLGDVDRLYLVLKNRDQYSLGDKLRALAQFFLPNGPNTRHEVNRLSDMGPAYFELKQYLRDLL